MTKPMRFVYRNWQGEIGTRCAVPQKIYWGSNEYHSEPQMLMEAYDLDKQAIRTFAIKDILEMKDIEYEFAAVARK